MVRFIIFIHLSYAHHLLHPLLYLSLPSQPRSQSKATSKSFNSTADSSYHSRKRVQSVRAGLQSFCFDNYPNMTMMHILKPMKVFAGTILTLLNKKRE
ncbi:hypothetical protein HanHA300_Chr04g0126741 [Helianthus annuus]|nr:hypothetical protein HanHA300_Chr04g0126741 [Helianthus annuus]KAJ0596167.1 hypothetical protein HanHA89_Chr04g0139651 [Helianthus annuus]KAJ0756818.1 hypothetical protein HanLR1_Chr04g0131391 [Helianthus annuus]